MRNYRNDTDRQLLYDAGHNDGWNDCYDSYEYHISLATEINNMHPAWSWLFSICILGLIALALRHGFRW